MHRAAASVVMGIAAMAIAVAAASCGSENSSASSGSGGFASGDSGAVGSVSLCTSAASCLVGQACCEPFDGGGPPACQAGPCPSSMQQVCAITAECLDPGFVCAGGAMPAGVMVCGPPDGGTDAQGTLGDASDASFQGDATVADGPTTDASTTGDASASEGGAPGDAAPGSDAATDGGDLDAPDAGGG